MHGWLQIVVWYLLRLVPRCVVRWYWQTCPYVDEFLNKLFARWNYRCPKTLPLVHCYGCNRIEASGDPALELCRVSLNVPDPSETNSCVCRSYEGNTYALCRTGVLARVSCDFLSIQVCVTQSTNRCGTCGRWVSVLLNQLCFLMADAQDVKSLCLRTAFIIADVM